MMLRKLRLPLLLTIFILVTNLKKVAADCAISKTYIENSNQSFLILDQNQNFVPLLRDSVPDLTNFSTICGTNVPIPNYCMNLGKMQEQLPTGNCPMPKAILQNATDPACPFNYYQVGYILGGFFVELYSTCYDRNILSANFTIHESYTDNLSIKRRDTAFTLDNIITGAQAKSFNATSVFNTFQALLGTAQTFITGPTESVIHRGHLAPNADFVFIQDKQATFKYLNVVPQFATINNGNWKNIEEWVRATPRKRPRNGHTHYRVLTGGHDVLKLPHSANPQQLVDMYLLNGNQNPIPKWMYKVVEKQNQCTVFITYNNIYGGNIPSLPTFCTRENCPPKVTLSSNITMGYTYCCNPSDFKRNIIPNVRIC